jgi:hypothetical protein
VNYRSVKFTVAIDQQFQGIGRGFQYFELFAGRAAESGFSAAISKLITRLRQLLGVFTPNSCHSYFLANYYDRGLTFTQYLV